MEKKIETEEMNNVEMCPAFPEIVPEVETPEEDEDDDDLEPQEEKYSNFADDEDAVVTYATDMMKKHSPDIPQRCLNALFGRLIENSAVGDGYRFIKLPDAFNEIPNLLDLIGKLKGQLDFIDGETGTVYTIGKLTYDNYLYFDEWKVKEAGAE